jgi:hypothetical protein
MNMFWAWRSDIKWRAGLSCFPECRNNFAYHQTNNLTERQRTTSSFIYRTLPITANMSTITQITIAGFTGRYVNPSSVLYPRNPKSRIQKIQKHAYDLSMNYTDRFLNHVLTNRSSLSQLITSYLVDKYPTVKINGIVRNPSKVPAKFSLNSNITIFEADSSDKAAVTKALKGSQVCICGYLGDNSLMTEGQKVLIDGCIVAGVPRYIAGDWSSDYRTIELGEVRVSAGERGCRKRHPRCPHLHWRLH